MDKNTLKDLIICMILGLVFIFILVLISLVPKPVKYVGPQVKQEDVDLLFALSMKKADQMQAELEKEILKKEIIIEHVEEAQEFGHSSHLDP